MKIRLSRFLLSASLLLAAFAAQAQNVSTDENVRIGKLKNGLTYYIRYNNWPEDRADFYIAQRVGSINEEENQRGLAHFLEHLCFNGTTNFPGNSVISYAESLGVKFGADLNAYTSTDETVYRICNVPTDNQAALDSCLLILHDWSNSLLLTDEDIDDERGVIKSEWRMRSGANYRMLERCAPKIFSGSRYGSRMPIGLMSVIDSFAYDELRDYYRKWYNPENQAIVVVGNIDIDHTEEQIKKLFSGIRTPKTAGKIVEYEVPDNEQIICAVESDPEQSGRMLTIYFKHDGLDESEVPTEAFFYNDYVKSVVKIMLNERLGDLSRAKDAPFTSAAVHDESFLIAKTKEAFAVRAMAKKDSTCGTARVLSREIARLIKYGFTQTEYERAAKKVRALIDDYYANRDRRSNYEFSQEYIRNYLDGEPIPSIEDYMDIINRVERSVSLEDANRYVRNNVSATDRNVVITAFCRAASDERLPTEEGLITAFREGRNTDAGPYVDNAVHGSVLVETPEAGVIVAEQALDQFGAKVWTLCNGVKVYLRHSDVKPNEIRISATSPGGYSINYSPEKVSTLRMLNEVISESAWGNYTKDELKKLLVGTNVNVTTGIELTEERLSAKASPDDLVTAMQLINLKMTSISRDDNAFDNLISSARTRIENQNSNPRYEMADSIFRYVYSHHPLAAKITAAELSDVSYDDVIGIYRDRFADASDFAFYITGNFDEAVLRPLVELYIASLPSLNRKEEAKDVGYHLASVPSHTEFSRAMETPQSIVYVYRSGEVEYSPKNVILANFLGSIMSNIYRREIREEKGWAYSIRGHCSVVAEINGGDKPHFNMPVNCPIQPGHERECLDIINTRLEEVAQNGVPAGELDKVKKYIVKNARDGLNDNAYWASVLKLYHKFGADFYNGYIEDCEAVTSDDIRDFVKNVILKGNKFELVMTPATADE